MKIKFNKVSCSMSIGINPEEYLKKQTVLISVSLTLNTTTAEIVKNKKNKQKQEDNTNLFFNYNEVYEMIKTVSYQQHWELQEELIFELSQRIFQLSKSIQTIDIYTEKVEAYSDCRSVGICETINRNNL